MTQIINLSKRLTAVASFLPQGAYFADIGSDHAHLPCFVCLEDDSARAIAGEVNIGPYESAYETVRSYNLTNRVEVQLGDGLEVLADTKVSELVIAGMGGSLITSILNNGKQYLHSVKRIIAQPNIGEKNVRIWFIKNGFTITNEVIIKESNHIYEILVADRDAKANPYLAEIQEKQLLFGPLLLKNKSKIFREKWRFQEIKLGQVIDQMKQATVQNIEKINQLEKELRWIKEVTSDGETNK